MQSIENCMHTLYELFSKSLVDTFIWSGSKYYLNLVVLDLDGYKRKSDLISYSKFDNSFDKKKRKNKLHCVNIESHQDWNIITICTLIIASVIILKLHEQWISQLKICYIFSLIIQILPKLIAIRKWTV